MHLFESFFVRLTVGGLGGMLLLGGCLGKLESETAATREEVQRSNQRMAEMEKSQALFGAIRYMNDVADPNISSRARFALMLFKQATIKDSDSLVSADDQIYFHVGAPAPLRLISNPALGLRNVTIINSEPTKPIDRNERIRSIHENIHAVQALAVKQWLERLFLASTSSENYDENRDEAYRAILVGKTVLGAAFGHKKARQNAYSEYGREAFYQTAEERTHYGNLMRTIRNNFRLADKIGDSTFRAYLTLMGVESLIQ